METIIITERKKSIITDSILLTVFCVVPLFFLIRWLFLVDEGRIFIVFLIIVTLFLPVVTISGYIWDVKQKIILSEGGIQLCYGRNFVDIMHFEGGFSIPAAHETPWSNVTGFHIDAYERQEPTEGGGYSTTIKYSLIVKIKNKDRSDGDFVKFSPDYYGISLGKFEEHPNAILAICEEYQKNIKREESDVK
ncbi:hypothetical protein SAMN05421594_0222 [Chryseobacterium oleae]|uniref:Uncharacterized protein n=1 Tax=Chryseobacterium oleae TaxID=491207 RepID=A0A1I4VEN4_CHROL|nr:hypothetical protein [Chryseobacterium oleae]SFM99687.1 hypothetical protein SAMN05421594_0222 [Chryseobacterium oleae]